MSDNVYEITWCGCGNRHGAILDILPEDIGEMVLAVKNNFNVALYAGLWLAWSDNPKMGHVEFVSEKEYDGHIRRAWGFCGECVSPHVGAIQHLEASRKSIAAKFFEMFSPGDLVFFDGEKCQVQKQAPEQAPEKRQAPKAPERKAGFVSEMNEFGIYLTSDTSRIQLLWERIAQFRVSHDYMALDWFLKGDDDAT